MDNSNINELDSYGVWVKPSSSSSSQIPDEQDTDTSDLSFDNLSDLVEDDSADDFFPQEVEKTVAPTNDTSSQEAETIETGNTSEFSLDQSIEEDMASFGSGETEPEAETTEPDESQLGAFEIPETSNNSFVNSDDNAFDPFETPSDDIFAIDDSMTGDPIVEEETEFEEQVNPYEDAFKDFTDITDDEDVSLAGMDATDSAEIDTEESHEEPVQETVTSETTSHIVENNSAESEILKQIVSELASLKSEIASLKENFNELRQKSEEVAVEQKVEEPPVDTGGFFTDDDGDETISLSGDELSNIMNSVDMSQTEIVDMSDVESQLESDPFAGEISDINEDNNPSPQLDDIDIGDMEENSSTSLDADIERDLSAIKIDDESVITEDSFGIIDEPTISEDIFAIEDEPTSEKETFEIPEDSFEADDNFEIPEDQIIDDAFDTVGSETDDMIDIAKDSDVTEYISESSEDSSEFDDIAFQSDFSVDENPGFISDELPDEISVPKDINDIVVASSDEDFMDSVKDAEDAKEKFGFMAEIPEELPYNAFESDTLGESVEEIENELNSLEQAADEEFETIQNVDDLMTADPEIHESITDSHMDYLKTDENAELDEKPSIIYNDDEQEAEEEVEETEESVSGEPRSFVNDLLDTRDQDSEIPNSLKSEIKSVLLYMDQLLENLPEEKIVEFAQSEQFNTYKKLFAELGLS